VVHYDWLKKYRGNQAIPWEITVTQPQLQTENETNECEPSNDVNATTSKREIKKPERLIEQLYAMYYPDWR
jgi:hypothetical protein